MESNRSQAPSSCHAGECAVEPHPTGAVEFPTDRVHALIYRYVREGQPGPEALATIYDLNTDLMGISFVNARTAAYAPRLCPHHVAHSARGSWSTVFTITVGSGI